MEFLAVNEEELLKGIYSPMGVVFCLIYSNKGYLLVQNSKSKYWELPAGSIRDGESLKDCAIRRCKETSNQNVDDLDFAGICKITFEKRNESEYFAIYTSKLIDEMPFAINEETRNIRWYNHEENFKPICRTSLNVISFYESLH